MTTSAVAWFLSWPGEVPDWLPARNEVLCGVIAVLDYGPEPIRYGARVPLGVNMAIRREALSRAGHFSCRIGRKAGTLLGQEVREWCVRAHAAGLVGYYIPDVVVQHLIPQDRLTKSYFRRWYYWRGVSRAILYADCGLDMENPEAPPQGSRQDPTDRRRSALPVPDGARETERYGYSTTVGRWRRKFRR